MGPRLRRRRRRPSRVLESCIWVAPLGTKSDQWLTDDTTPKGPIPFLQSRRVESHRTVSKSRGLPKEDTVTGASGRREDVGHLPLP